MWQCSGHDCDCEVVGTTGAPRKARADPLRCGRQTRKKHVEPFLRFRTGFPCGGSSTKAPSSGCGCQLLGPWPLLAASGSMDTVYAICCYSARSKRIRLVHDACLARPSDTFRSSLLTELLAASWVGDATSEAAARKYVRTTGSAGRTAACEYGAAEQTRALNHLQGLLDRSRGDHYVRHARRQANSWL